MNSAGSSPRKFELKKSTEIRNASKFTTDELIDIKAVKCEVKDNLNEKKINEEEDYKKENDS